jgi:hypothetical protein
MFKRIHSNRDPNVTVWSELQKEFGCYFNKAGTFIKSICINQPKTVFGLMISLLLLSAVLSFTLFRHPIPVQKVVVKKPVVEDGFGRILETTAALQRTLALKKEVETILGKGHLTASDSLALNRALDSLHLIQQQIHAH